MTELDLLKTVAQDEGEFEATLPLKAESTSALRKLLEAKDCAVRATQTGVPSDRRNLSEVFRSFCE